MEIKCQFEYSGLGKAKLSCLWQLLKDNHNRIPCIYMLTQKLSCLWQLLKDNHNATSRIYMQTQKTWSHTKAAAPI